MCGSYPGNVLSNESNKKVAEFVTSFPYIIVMGSGERGSMGAVKEIVLENGRDLIVVGPTLDLISCKADIKIPVESTFERLEEIYENTDAILFLDGGTGTLAEFNSFLNNKIETEDDKPLIVYNENGSYNLLLNDLEERRKMGLVKDNYKQYFEEAKNMKALDIKLKEAEEKYNNRLEKKGRVR